MTQNEASISGLLPIWVRGWALACGVMPPQIQAGGTNKVGVGQPEQLGRTVYPGNRPDAVAQRARELTAPASWLKVCVRSEDLAPLLPTHWAIADPGFFMHTRLRSNTGWRMPAGYMLASTRLDSLNLIHITTLAGEPACRGRVAMLGRHAVFDQIITEPAQQRQGLGRALMLALAEYAVTSGAAEGLLVATAQGQCLYHTLNWYTVSPYSSAWIPNGLPQPELPSRQCA